MIDKEKQMDSIKSSLIFLGIVFFLWYLLGPCVTNKVYSKSIQQNLNALNSANDHSANNNNPSVEHKNNNDRLDDESAKQLFSKGYRLFEKKEYEKAVPYFYHYLQQSSADITDYEWVEFFFGICLKKCGLSHAAVDVLSHLVIRKPNPKIVSYSLELFEEITRTIPFDRDLIILNVICDQEYGFVEQKISDFIHYYQGLFDWEHGFFQWGNDHFQNITPNTYYYYKYLYHQAL